MDDFAWLFFFFLAPRKNRIWEKNANRVGKGNRERKREKSLETITMSKTDLNVISIIAGTLCAFLPNLRFSKFTTCL